MLGALRSLRDDEERLSLLATKQTMDLIPSGLRRMVTKEELLLVIDNAIAEQSTVDAPQRRYLATMETMMSFVDEHMLHGIWQILRASPDHPFVIGDAPVVTWERANQSALTFGQGFARPNVEVVLPIFPTACLHILPMVERTRPVRRPTVDEVNRAQPAFATLHCFSNICSTELDALLQPWFGKVRLGIDGFNINHLDHAQKFFEILMNQRPLPGSKAR